MPNGKNKPPAEARTTNVSAKCNHTLNHDDPAGTWQVVAKTRRVVCSGCKRFYGYVSEVKR